MWYENGQLRRKVNYVDGKKDGFGLTGTRTGSKRSTILSAAIWCLPLSGNLMAKYVPLQCEGWQRDDGKYTDDGTEWLRISYKDGERRVITHLQ